MSRQIQISFTIIAFAAMHSIAAAADNKTATQYADDAVTSMQRENDALAKLAQTGKISSADLRRATEELFEARILLLTLKHDEIGITTLLREKVNRSDQHFAKLSAAHSDIPVRQVE